MADAVAEPKPKSYRCPNGSYTITEAMCIGRQQNNFHLCPKCVNRAALPQAATPPSPVTGPPNPN